MRKKIIFVLYCPFMNKDKNFAQTNKKIIVFIMTMKTALLARGRHGRN